MHELGILLCNKQRRNASIISSLVTCHLSHVTFHYRNFRGGNASNRSESSISIFGQRSLRKS